MLVFYALQCLFTFNTHLCYDSIITIKPLLLNHQILPSLLMTIFIISQLHKAMELETDKEKYNKMY